MKTLGLYKNPVEYILDFFGVNSMKVFVLTTSIVLLSGFIPYFEQHIYFNFYCLVLFNLSMCLDVFSAIVLAKIRGGSFETKLAMKALAKFLAYNYLLYLSNFLNDAMAGTDADSSFYAGLATVTSDGTASAIKGMFAEYHLSPFAVFLYAFIVTSLSILKNFQLSDAFQNIKRIDRWLYKYIDVYKNRPEDRMWDEMTVKQQKKILHSLGEPIPKDKEE